jgi:hypothetical protein
MLRLTAVAYYAGIPPNNKNLEKPLILDNFIAGVNASDDIGIAHRSMSTLNCDVALIQGFVHNHGKSLPHLVLRQQALDLQKKNGKRSLIVDSNLFLYADTGNTKTYLRYSFDGVTPTTGFYFDRDIDGNRWSKISKDLGISLKPWRSTGNHILICLQRNGGWSMRGLDVCDWLDSIISKIRNHSSRKIIVRPHPGDKKIQKFLRIKHANVFVSNSTNIVNDLRSAWATVVYNSSPAVASAIEGIPVFVTDPEPKNSQAYPVANLDLSLLENPEYKDREHWIKQISMSHWNFQELRSGEAWRFFKKYL